MKKLLVSGIVWILAFGVVVQLGLWLTLLFAAASLLYWLAGMLKKHRNYIRVAIFAGAVAVVLASIWFHWLPTQQSFVQCADSPVMKYLGTVAGTSKPTPTDVQQPQVRFEREVKELEERAAQLIDAPSAIRGSDSVAAWLASRGSTLDSSGLTKTREALRTYLQEKKLFELEDLRKQIQAFKDLNAKFRLMFATNANPSEIKQQYDRAVVSLPFELAAKLLDDLRRETSTLLAGGVRVNTSVAARLDEANDTVIYEEHISLSANDLPLVKVNLAALTLGTDPAFEHQIAVVDPVDNKEILASDPREVFLGQGKTNARIVHRVLQRNVLKPACAELALPGISLRPTRRVEMRWPNPFQANFVVWVRLAGIANEPEVAVQGAAKREDSLNFIGMPPHSVMLSNWKKEESDAGDRLEPRDEKSILWFRQGNHVWAELVPDWWFLRNTQFRQVRSYVFTENLLMAGLTVFLGALLAAFVKKGE